MDSQVYNMMFLFVVSFLPAVFIMAGIFFFMKKGEWKKRLMGFVFGVGLIIGAYNAFITGGPVNTIDAGYVPEPEGGQVIQPSEDFIPDTQMDDYRNRFKEYEKEQDKRIQDSE